MANYRYYIARSKNAFDNPSIPTMDFHLRIRTQSDEGNPPYLRFDPNAAQKYQVDIENSGAQTHYTISVWLEEIEQNKGIVYKDAIFTTPNPPDYNKITARIIVHLKPLLGPVRSFEPGPTDQVVDPMDTEHPIDDDLKRR